MEMKCARLTHILCECVSHCVCIGEKLKSIKQWFDTCTLHVSAVLVRFRFLPRIRRVLDVRAYERVWARQCMSGFIMWVHITIYYIYVFNRKRNKSSYTGADEKISTLVQSCARAARTKLITATIYLPSIRLMHSWWKHCGIANLIKMKKEPSNERHSGTLLPNSGHTDEQQPTQIERKNATTTAATTSVYVFFIKCAEEWSWYGEWKLRDGEIKNACIGMLGRSEYV